MADKFTVTMYHRESDTTIEVLPSSVENQKVSGWTTEKYVEPSPVKEKKKSTKPAKGFLSGEK